MSPYQQTCESVAELDQSLRRNGDLRPGHKIIQFKSGTEQGYIRVTRSFGFFLKSALVSTVNLHTSRLLHLHIVSLSMKFQRRNLPTINTFFIQNQKNKFFDNLLIHLPICILVVHNLIFNGPSAKEPTLNKFLFYPEK